MAMFGKLEPQTLLQCSWSTSHIHQRFEAKNVYEKSPHNSAKYMQIFSTNYPPQNLMFSGTNGALPAFNIFTGRSLYKRIYRARLRLAILRF